MEMTPDEVIDMIATLEQENMQLRARNERLQEVLNRIQEIVESNK
jgi:cell division septum initiation protein DivIVA